MALAADVQQQFHEQHPTVTLSGSLFLSQAVAQRWNWLGWFHVMVEI
jgi:hypothetical protein